MYKGWHSDKITKDKLEYCKFLKSEVKNISE